MVKGMLGMSCGDASAIGVRCDVKKRKISPDRTRCAIEVNDCRHEGV